MAGRIIIILFVCISALFQPAEAQVIPPEQDHPGPLPPDAKIGSYYSVFPLAGYTSDLGFIGGGFLQRINYDINETPFLSNLKTDAVFSTKGYMVAKLEYERIRMFGIDFRSRVDFTGMREKRAHYFGIGNNADFSEDLYSDDYFFYESREFALNYQARDQWLEYGGNGRVDLYGEFTLSYAKGLPFNETSLYQDDMPPGFGSNWINKLGFGIIADSRDNEFAPEKGIRYQAGVNFSTSFFGSDYSFTEFRAEMRHFIPVAGSLVLAHKLEAVHQLGEAPFWALPVIGTENGLRGFHRNRFRGGSSLLNIFELRTWLFSFWDDQIAIGAQAFWDTGRVYSDFDSAAFFGDWKHSFGIGGAISVFSPDIIVRGDLGFSDETYRIYFGAGYIF